MMRLTGLLSAFALAFLLSGAAPGDTGTGADRPRVFRATVDNRAINPVTQRYLQRAVRQAEDQGAQCLVIVLDTPGGLVNSTRDIVKLILGSRVPVIVYVAPSGARAASAGLFITLSGHVAAMAPGTAMGAAHPVSVGGLPGSPPQQDREKADKTPMEEKILHDTVAWARSLAELRDRDEEARTWVVQAVKESISAPASEALEKKVIDLLAQDFNDLLRQLDGRTVALNDREVTLRTVGAEIRDVEMWWGERLLAALTNPNVAFLLLIFGFYGIMFEMMNPGWGVPGTLGIIFLLLGFLALAVLPVNYVGLALLAVALALFVAEVFVTSYGALTAGGVVCLVLGGTLLIDSPTGFQRVSLAVILPVALATAVIVFFLVGSVLQAHRGRVQTGGETLLGETAVALSDFRPEGGVHVGMVRLHGEIWNAVSAVPVSSGQTLEVDDREGLTLGVHPSTDGQTTGTSQAMHPGKEEG